jgi:meiosis-specific protein HOP1
MLAIYLDPNDPTNLVECYTFTFKYETDSEGNRVSAPSFPTYSPLIQISNPQRPEMVVRDQMSGMVISGTSTTTQTQSKAVKEGDAKRQAQKMIKTYVFTLTFC